MNLAEFLKEISKIQIDLRRAGADPLALHLDLIETKFKQNRITFEIQLTLPTGKKLSFDIIGY